MCKAKSREIAVVMKTGMTMAEAFNKASAFPNKKERQGEK